MGGTGEFLPSRNWGKLQCWLIWEVHTISPQYHQGRLLGGGNQQLWTVLYEIVWGDYSREGVEWTEGCQPCLRNDISASLIWVGDTAEMGGGLSPFRTRRNLRLPFKFAINFIVSPFFFFCSKVYICVSPNLSVSGIIYLNLWLLYCFSSSIF